MNIKGVFGNINTTPMNPVERIGRPIKSDNAHDRDPNGQQNFDDQKKEHHEPMTEDQIEKAIEHLRQLAVVKEHHWTIELILSENKKFVLVKDTDGNIIRRIPELELWTLPIDANDPKGQLLKKTA